MDNPHIPVFLFIVRVGHLAFSSPSRTSADLLRREENSVGERKKHRLAYESDTISFLQTYAIAQWSGDGRVGFCGYRHLPLFSCALPVRYALCG